MKFRRLLGPVVLFLCFPACSGKKDLSRDTAASLIQKSDLLQAAGLKIKTGRFCSNLNSQFLRSVLHDYRLYSNDPNGPFLLLASLQPQGLSSMIMDGDQEAMMNDWIARGGSRETCCVGCYVVAFTTKGGEHVKNGDWKFLEREGINETYQVPWVRAGQVEVTGIAASANPNLVSADFSWKLIPSEQSKMFSAVAPVLQGIQQSVATLQLYDDGWRVIKIDAK